MASSGLPGKCTGEAGGAPQWAGSHLQRAMASLDLHRRIVALGIDGSLYWHTTTMPAATTTGGFGPQPTTAAAAAGDPQRQRKGASSPTAAEPPGRSTAGGGSSGGLCEGAEQFNFFQRAVLWRIYLRVLPFPFNATTIDNLTANWCETLFKQRAWYRSMEQAFLERYPEIARAIVVDGPAAAAVAEEEEAEEVRDVPRGPRVDTAATTAAGTAKAGAAPAPGAEARPRAASTGAEAAKTTAPGLGAWRERMRQSTQLRRPTSLAAATAPAENRPHESSRRGAAAAAAASASGSGGGPLRMLSDDIIAMDIRRSYLVNDPHAPHDALFRILAVWRYLNPLIGYHQGMHEIAGNCLSLLLRGALAVPRDAPIAIRECCNPTYAEADAFVLFDTIMIHFGLGELFVPSHVLNQHRGAGIRSVIGAEYRRPDFTDMGENDPTTKLEVVCHYIVQELLKNHSTTLYHHLANTGCLEQCLLFLPRWVRNLFTREVSVAQAYALWDGIFAIYYYDLMQQVMTLMDRKQRQARLGLHSGQAAQGRDGDAERGGKKQHGMVGEEGESSPQGESKGTSTGFFGKLFRNSGRRTETEARGSSVTSDASSAAAEQRSGEGDCSGGKDDGIGMNELEQQQQTGPSSVSSASSPHLIIPSTPLTVLGTSPVANIQYAGQAAAAAAAAAGGGGGGGGGASGAGAITSSPSSSPRGIPTGSTARRSLPAFLQKLGNRGSGASDAASSSGGGGGGSSSGMLSSLMAMADEVAASSAPSSFSRTVAGIALVLLMFIEDDILAAPDDFSVLKCLTRTPLIPTTVDPIVILSKAMTLARTRPAGIVPYSLQRAQRLERQLLRASGVEVGDGEGGSDDEGGSGGADQKRSSVALPLLLPPRSGAHDAVASFAISREDLFQQQQALAVVMQSMRGRLLRVASEGRAAAAAVATAAGAGGKVTKPSSSAGSRSGGGGLFSRTTSSVGKGGYGDSSGTAAILTEDHILILESTADELNQLSLKLQ